MSRAAVMGKGGGHHWPRYVIGLVIHMYLIVNWRPPRQLPFTCTAEVHVQYIREFDLSNNIATGMPFVLANTLVGSQSIWPSAGLRYMRSAYATNWFSAPFFLRHNDIAAELPNMAMLWLANPQSTDEARECRRHRTWEISGGRRPWKGR